MSITDVAGSGVLPLVSSLPSECWSAIGEQIRSLRTLQALVRTCHTFQDIFTPSLYRFWKLELSKYSPSELIQRSLFLPAGIRHTRDFEILIREFPYTGMRETTYNTSMNESYAKCIAKVLKEMTNIRAFRWIDASFVESYGPPLILRYPQLLRILKESQTLKHISLLFASQWLPFDERPAAANCSITLKGFCNLTSLEVYNFYGDHEHISRDLVSALADSPHLRTLGLALACDCDCNQLPEVVILEDEADFFESLCIEYASRSTRLPLPLRTLKLGHGIYLFKSKSTAIDNYLAKLVELSNLRTLHIFNGLIKMGSIDEEGESMEVEWSFFKDCTSLHQLSVTRLEDDVRDWLNTVGKSVQELIITDSYGTYDAELENFNALNLPHLSTLSTREYFCSKPDSEDEWTDVDSEESFESHVESQSDLVADDPTNTDSEAGRLPAVDKSIRTVLDRLHDGGSKLSRLCLDLDFETQWEQFSSCLSKMHHLNQLRVCCRTWRMGQYPTKESSLWATVQKPKDIAYRYAQLIKDICPSMQYIRIHNWSWEFVALRRFIPPSNRPILRELEFEEVLAIEILSFDNFPPQAGLPGPELPPERPSEHRKLTGARMLLDLGAVFRVGAYDELDF